MLSAVLVAGCQSREGVPREANINAKKNEAAAVPVADNVPPARVTVEPADNTTNVRLDSTVKVTAAGGKLTEVRVTQADGTRLDGALSKGATTWTSTQPLAPDTVYRVQATALNAEGYPTKVDKTFSTLKPRKVLEAEITPTEGSAVGVGMPISVKFSEPVKNKAAVERRLLVETSKPIVGAWHWFSDEEVRFRPKTYWPAHTKVTVRANLRGVASGAGAWGLEDKVRNFSITNSVVTKVDLAKHHAYVYIDGKLARTIPVTGGKAGWRTRDGVKVVLEKRENVIFTNEQIGAPESYRLHSRWALRLTWSGEFIHTAWWSVGSHGRANVSHGCIGMNTENSEWLWKNSHVGDPVEVHSPDGNPMEPNNGYGDWNFSWEEWTAGSALV
jgi:lipoprotein-anchoring transpeptidase ErfK/SrfK